ncbi:MAG: 50S ribosomal protein L9 [Bacillota bacterium]|nr:50S ribosomal protein L9 [Bacillota bacterium]
MKVLLLKDVKGLGQAGQVVEVAEGYGRNYLLPRGLAADATPDVLEEVRQREARKERQRKKEREEALALRQAVEGKTLTLPARAGGGKLFGSITTRDIAAAMEKEWGIKLDKKLLRLENPIKTPGAHQVEAHLYPGLDARFTVLVVPEEAKS